MHFILLLMPLRMELFSIILKLFISTVQKYNWLFYIDLVSCNLVEYVQFFSPYGFLRFLYIQDHVICEQKQLYFFLLISMPFISFSCLNALAKTCSTILNRSCESSHPCLILDLREKAFSLSPLGMMLTVMLSQMSFIMLSKFFSLTSLLNVFFFSLQSRKDVGFCQMFLR